jgi:signal transduction histidine kinase
MQDWSKVVAQLEERLGSLHKIDKGILDDTLRLEEICAGVLEDVVRLSMADVGYVYVFSGADFQFLTGYEVGPGDNLAPVHDNDAFKSREAEPFILEDVSGGVDLTFPKVRATSRVRILVPIRPRGRLWGVVGFETGQAGGESPLENQAVQAFFQIVKGQLEIAVRDRMQYEEILQLSRLQNELFMKELDISDSLQSIIENIKRALPDNGPFQINPDPEVQILYYREGDEFMSIKATSGVEQLNTRILVSESISGILVEQPNLPYFLCDPRTSPDRYRSYLGKAHSGAPKKEIQTELVLPLRYDDKLIGILNLESELPDAFKFVHIESLMRLAEKISPIINALQKRAEKMQFQDRASIYALNRFLTRFAMTYKHKLATPTQRVRLTLNELTGGRNLAGLDEPLRQYLSENLNFSLDAVEEMAHFHDNFSNDLPGYLIYGKYKINELVEGAIKELRPEALKRKYDIDIEFDPADDYEVYCSLFLREHIYNVLNNSKESLMERKLTEPLHEGKIRVQTAILVDEEESRLNKRCVLTVIDNGLGLEPSKLAKIPSPKFTTKGQRGTGFGLYSAFQYLKGIGGELEVDSVVNELFKVTMTLDLYGETIHGELGSISLSQGR